MARVFPFPGCAFKTMCFSVDYVKCFSLLDYSYNVPFNDKYKEFIDEYEEELLNIHKRNIATKQKQN